MSSPTPPQNPSASKGAVSGLFPSRSRFSSNLKRGLKEGFHKYLWMLLGFVLATILWGAFVRHTGSGAGCGGSWPLCNGEIIPRPKGVETVIEFTHRLTSGLAWLLVLGSWVISRLLYPQGHGVRRALARAFVFTTLSALFGAAFVLMGWVGSDSSIGRAVALAVHMLNTLLLLGSLTLAGLWASGFSSLHIRHTGVVGWLCVCSLVAVTLSGVSGAVTSLGDTVFPPGSTAEVIQAGLSPTAHVIVRLRLWHPFIAVGSALICAMLWALVGDVRRDRGTRRALGAMLMLLSLQIMLGIINVSLKAPTSLALLHLLTGHLFWISLVVASAYALRAEPAEGMPLSHRQEAFS